MIGHCGHAVETPDEWETPDEKVRTIRQGENDMITRRRFSTIATGALLGAAGSTVSWNAEAADAEFAYKFATTAPADDPVSVHAQKVADRVKEATNGRMVIQVFPYGQLGTDSSLLSSVRSGAVEFINASDNLLSNVTAVSAVSAVGFAFRDYEEAWKSLDGDLGTLVRGNLGKFGITLMDRVWDSGFRQVYTATKPIDSVNDLAGLKIRVPVTPIVFSMFKGMGATPISINFNEVYSALQAHLADAMETALIAFLNGKFYEVQKYCSLTNHSWSGYWIAANAAAFNRLPKDLQDTVRSVMNETADEERQHSKKENLSTAERLKQHSIAINAPTDTQSFRESLRKNGYYQFWEQKIGPEAWAALEKYSGKLT